MEDFCPKGLPAAVTDCLGLHQEPSIDKERFRGGQCQIFKASLQDGRVCAVRIPLYVRNASREDIVLLLQGELDIVRYLRKRGFNWGAEDLGSSLTFDNLTGFPFIVLSWIEGRPLHWSDKLSRSTRDKILEQLALIHVELLYHTLANNGTATSFFDRVMNNRLLGVCDGKFDNITKEDCLEQQKQVRCVLDPELDSTPYAMNQGDMAPANLIMGSEWQINGIIDPGMAQMVPMQYAAGFPRILQLPSPRHKIDSTLERDRRSYLAFVASLESLYPQVVCWILRVQGDEHVDFNACILESIMSKGMHTSMACLGWKLPFCKNPTIRVGSA